MVKKPQLVDEAIDKPLQPIDAVHHHDTSAELIINVQKQQEQQLHDEDMHEDERMPEVIDDMCEYCMTLHVKNVPPPKRPLSPFIFFSQEVSNQTKNINFLKQIY